MALTAHLSYSGKCEEAFNFYSQIFGGQVSVLKYVDTPMAQEVPAEWHEKIVHGTFSFAGGVLAGADVLPEHYRRPQGFSVLVDVEGVDHAENVFSALADGGSVEVPMQETFWSPAFGMLVDRFGVPWEINGTSAPAK